MFALIVELPYLTVTLTAAAGASLLKQCFICSCRYSFVAMGEVHQVV